MASPTCCKVPVYTAKVSILPDKLTLLDESEDMPGKSVMTGIDENGKKMSGPLHNPKTTLIGYDSPNISDDFTDGKRKIIEGKAYTDGEKECLVSQQLAKLNNLKLGDTVSVFGSMDEKAQDFKISGIYSDSTSATQPQLPFKDPMMNRSNEILTSRAAVAKTPFLDHSGYLDPQFALKDPDQLDAFTKELKAKGLPNSYKVTTDADSYKKITAPVGSLQKLATVFLVLVIILGALVLLLVSLMNMRSRQYEIGVLRAIGMKKSKLSLGLVSEVFVMVAFCLLAGLAVGGGAAQPIAKSMLASQTASYEQQTKEAEKSQENGMVFVSGPGQDSTPKDIKPAEITTKIDKDSLIQIVSVSMIIVVLSSAVSVYYTMRLEPRKILAKGN